MGRRAGKSVNLPVFSFSRRVRPKLVFRRLTIVKECFLPSAERLLLIA